MTAGQWFWTAVIVALFATIVWLILEEHFRELQAVIDLALIDTDDDGLFFICADEFAWVNDDDYDMPTPLRTSDTVDRISGLLAANEAARADWDEPSRWGK